MVIRYVVVYNIGNQWSSEILLWFIILGHQWSSDMLWFIILVHQWSSEILLWFIIYNIGTSMVIGCNMIYKVGLSIVVIHQNTVLWIKSNNFRSMWMKLIYIISTNCFYFVNIVLS